MTVHFIDDSLKLYSVVLETTAIPERHTAKKFAELLQKNNNFGMNNYNRTERIPSVFRFLISVAALVITEKQVPKATLISLH